MPKSKCFIWRLPWRRIRSSVTQNWKFTDNVTLLYERKKFYNKCKDKKSSIFMPLSTETETPLSNRSVRHMPQHVVYKTSICPCYATVTRSWFHHCIFRSGSWARQLLSGSHKPNRYIITVCAFHLGQSGISTTSIIWLTLRYFWPYPLGSLSLLSLPGVGVDSSPGNSPISLLKPLSSYSSLKICFCLWRYNSSYSPGVWSSFMMHSELL